MKQNCFSAQPGTLLFYKDQVWRITANDTLDRIIRMETIEGPRLTKAIHYQPGQELNIRWSPNTRR